MINGQKSQFILKVNRRQNNVTTARRVRYSNRARYLSKCFETPKAPNKTSLQHLYS